jgi:thymidine kinase
VLILKYLCFSETPFFFYGDKDINNRFNLLKMFLENTHTESRKKGWIEVICGSMFSGKTEELIRRMRRALYAKQKVEIFKPEVDTRYDVEKVVSHDENFINSTPVPSSSQILLLANDVEVVGIDEAQFFDNELASVCNELASRGIRVIVAGLDMDFQGKPFGPIPSLMATAEYVTKVHAICLGCGGLAMYSHRLVDNDKLVLLGEKDSYIPLCRQCYLDRIKKAQYNL